MSALAPHATLVQTPKRYRTGDQRVRPVGLAVMHWTGSPPRHPGDANSGRMMAWLVDTMRQTSTHLVILRDGSVIQAAGLDERTWHAGGSTWIDPSGVARKSVNGMSIGVDLEAVGHLRRAPDGSGFIDGYGGRYKGAAPVKVDGEWWEPYAEAQVAALLDVARWLAAEIPALRDPARWVGHCDIQIGKADPGPHFPWPALRAAVSEV